jgi:hypothetical protein
MKGCIGQQIRRWSPMLPKDYFKHFEEEEKIEPNVKRICIKDCSLEPYVYISEEDTVESVMARVYNNAGDTAMRGAEILEEHGLTGCAFYFQAVALSHYLRAENREAISKIIGKAKTVKDFKRAQLLFNFMPAEVFSEENGYTRLEDQVRKYIEEKKEKE